MTLAWDVSRTAVTARSLHWEEHQGGTKPCSG
jgi:hypothetical protein